MCAYTDLKGHTLTESILVHWGEARASRDAFVSLSLVEQTAIVQFLKTLRVLPAGSPLVVICSAPREIMRCSLAMHSFSHRVNTMPVATNALLEEA